MKSLFSAYGTSGVIRLPLYTSGTENVSWVKGIDSQTGTGFGTSANTYTEGGSYITLKIVNEPTGFITANIAGVTNSTVDLTGYKRACVDWEVISEGTFGLIVSSEKNDDINEFDAKVTYGAGTGRKTSYLAINALTGSYYIRVNAYALTNAPNTQTAEIRIHKVWLEK
jgi:hypothetical protein